MSQSMSQWHTVCPLPCWCITVCPLPCWCITVCPLPCWCITVCPLPCWCITVCPLPCWCITVCPLPCWCITVCPLPCWCLTVCPLPCCSLACLFLSCCSYKYTLSFEGGFPPQVGRYRRIDRFHFHLSALHPALCLALCLLALCVCEWHIGWCLRPQPQPHWCVCVCVCLHACVLFSHVCSPLLGHRRCRLVHLCMCCVVCVCLSIPVRRFASGSWTKATFWRGLHSGPYSQFDWESN